MRVCHCDLEVTVSSLSLVLRNPLQEGLVGNLHLAKSPNIVQRVEQRNLAGRSECDHDSLVEQAYPICAMDS